MPELMNCELLATCNALGFCEGSVYHKEPDSLETVKDLIRFLRREDDTREIRRQLGYAQIVQNDLIPIIKRYSDDNELFETIIRLLVNLSQPAELCFNNKIPDDKTFHHYYLEVQNNLQSCKESFADEDFMAVLARKLKTLLDLEWEDRREEHTLLMERILLLVRNILHIPADPNQEKRTDDDASIHDQVLWVLNTSGLDKLLLYISSAEGEQQWCMHVVEIISLMLREQEPEQLAKTGIGRSDSEKEKEGQELELARQREQAERKFRLLKYSTRHSRFGGTFCIKNVKSISDNELIYHRSITTTDNINFDHEKATGRKPRHRQPMKDSDLKRRSTLSIRLFLKEFSVLFLENCYNPLMHSVRDNLVHDRAQKNDESYYLWAMRFFMAFSRHHSFRVDVVSETFSIQCFHYIETNLQNYYEMMLTDKKEITQWSRRMHLALKAYGELLLTLDAMDHCKDPSIKDGANVIKSNIFYVMEYREIFPTLLRKYDPAKLPKSFLKDLVETTHVFVKMLERHVKGRRSIVVQKKVKKRRKKNPRKDRNAVDNAESSEVLDESWDRVTGDLSAMLQSREDVPDNVAPFDAAAEIPVEEQRASTMTKIQQSLHDGQAGEALSLLRAAREVWPENDVFGAADISPEDEFMAIREIHFASLPRLNLENGEVNEDDHEELEEDEDDGFSHYTEEEFNFDAYIRKFGNSAVLKSYVTSLSRYKDNSLFTNHCIIKMLHRVAFDCKMIPLLFQISLFRVFQCILIDPLVSATHLQEAAKFSKYIVGHFFAMAKNNDKMFVEMLFWKNSKDVLEINEGYGTVSDNRASKKRGLEWREEEQEELRQLYEEYKDDDSEDKDVVDQIMEHIIDDTKTRRQIINQLVKQELVDSVADLKRKKGSKRIMIWREEQELELRNLFDQYRESDDVVGNILENLTEKRSKYKVIEKLLAMGVVSDKKELYKKRKKSSKPRNKKAQEDDDDDDDDIEEMPEYDESDEDNDRVEDEYSDVESDRERNYDNLSLSKLIDKVKQAGFMEQIKWILTGLKRTADDRQTEDTSEPVAIVPLTIENEEAMEHGVFKSFLRTIGMAPPSSHQEIFWRIPGELTADDLVHLADSIEGSGDKKMTDRYRKLNELVESRRKERNSGDKRNRRKKLSEKRAMAAVMGDAEYQSRVRRDSVESSDDERTEERANEPDDALNESDDESSGINKRKSKPIFAEQARRILIDNESDDESIGVQKRKSKPMSAEQVRMILTDDESGDESIGVNKRKSKPISAEQTRRILTDDESEDESIGVQKRKSKPMSAEQARIILTDDESDDEPLASQMQKNMKLLLPDSDDEEIKKDRSLNRLKRSYSAILSDSESDVEDSIPLKRVVRRKIESDSDDE